VWSRVKNIALKTLFSQKNPLFSKKTHCFPTCALFYPIVLKRKMITASNACRFCGCTRWLRTCHWSLLLPTDDVSNSDWFGTMIAVSQGCVWMSALAHILSSCSDTTFAQAIPYCLAGNGTLVCTDRLEAVF